MFRYSVIFYCCILFLYLDPYEIHLRESFQKKLSTQYCRPISRDPPMLHMPHLPTSPLKGSNPGNNTQNYNNLKNSNPPNISPNPVAVPLSASQPVPSVTLIPNPKRLSVSNSAVQAHQRNSPPAALQQKAYIIASGGATKPANDRTFFHCSVFFILWILDSFFSAAAKKKLFLELTSAKPFDIPEKGEVEDCVVCMDSLANPQEPAFTLKCNHTYHLNCILPWYFPFLLFCWYDF